MSMVTETGVINEYDEYDEYDEYGYHDRNTDEDVVDECETSENCDESSDESGDESDDSQISIERHLNKTINIVKTVSFDHYRCVICLLNNGDDANNEPVVINHVCETCTYCVHDSCFSVWYGNTNKCIICRRILDSRNCGCGLLNRSSADDPTIVAIMEQHNIATVGGGFFVYVSNQIEPCMRIIYLICAVWLLCLLLFTCDNSNEPIERI